MTKNPIHQIRERIKKVNHLAEGTGEPVLFAFLGFDDLTILWLYIVARAFWLLMIGRVPGEKG